MKLVAQTPKKVLKAFLKQKPLRSEIDVFKTNLIALLDKISVIEKRPTDESEEHLKNDLRDFLRDTYYRATNAINTKDKKDLVIHLGKTTDSEVGIIIEAKRPTNINEMVTADNPNKKALHELILYYLDERNQAANNQLKQLVMTNVNQWFIVDANYFDKHIYRNTQIKKLYETKRNDKKDNPWFYEEIAKIVSKIDAEIPCVYFDIKDYDKVLRNNNKEDDKELIALFKILSPQHLLKIATPNDSNSLNEKFYKELLHIIGLEEAKENGKNIIRRKKESRFAASLIEATIEALVTDDPFHRLPDQSIYGENKEERVFNVSLELCITWINRILFLKLLEGQLITYHQGNKDYRFLNSETIHDFDELFKLFHKVLAVNLQDRSEAIKTKYNRVPYLNSSLFEISELEDQTIKINSLDNSGHLELIGTTILKDTKKKAASLPSLDYLFQFLDAYDFASEGAEDVQEDNKTIINASVLGKVFEKINGYKDGSVFTPAFITMYMCKQSIRLAVVEKFNNAKKWDIKQFDELYNKIDDKKEANEIINSLKICDPAVGSGHFLVSALNEIIAVKSELGVLIDEKGKTLRDYEIEIVNDELIITDENGNIIAYNPKNIESNRVQKTLFQEKQTIIENCLFGVDINPNSVKICRLRLWIELLKNAYYKEETKFTELETLPNIDINIKCGNSLLSRFPLDADLSKALKSIKYDVKAYRGFVNDYKNEKSRDVKRGLQKIIDSIKGDFRTEIGNNDPKQVKLKKLSGDLFTLLNQAQIFELTPKEKKARKEKQSKLEVDITKLSKEIEEIKSNAIYKNAFEWRFEFPEVLSNSGEFEGFDVVIGNPPYIKGDEIVNQKSIYALNYRVFTGNADLYTYFFERGLTILKPKGLLSFITPNKWIQSNYGIELRRFIIEKDIKELIDFGELSVFDEASTFPSILLISNQNPINNELLFAEIESIEHFISHNFVFQQVSTTELKPEKWILDTNETSVFINKLEKKFKPLGEIFNNTLYAGIKTGANEVLILTKEKVDEITKNNPDEKFLFRKICFGKDFKKYQNEIINPKYLFYPYEYDDKTNKLININKYPATLKYLNEHKVKLSNRAIIKEGIEKGTHHWYELQQINRFFDYTKNKIIYPDIALDNRFFYDENGLLPDMTCFFIPTDKKEYIGILNSSLFKYLASKYCPVLGNVKQGGRIRYKSTYLVKIPMPIPDQSQKEFLLSKTIEIISNKNKGKDSTDLEQKIDELVYKLYDITAEEQKIIEAK